MDREEFADKIKSVRENIGDEAVASELLTEIFDGVDEFINRHETTVNQNEELTNANEKLRASNMDLMLRIPVVKKDVESEPDEPGEDEKTRTWDDWYNRKK